MNFVVEIVLHLMIELLNEQMIVHLIFAVKNLTLIKDKFLIFHELVSF